MIHVETDRSTGEHGDEDVPCSVMQTLSHLRIQHRCITHRHRQTVWSSPARHDSRTGRPAMSACTSSLARALMSRYPRGCSPACPSRPSTACQSPTSCTSQQPVSPARGPWRMASSTQLRLASTSMASSRPQPASLRRSWVLHRLRRTRWGPGRPTAQPGSARRRGECCSFAAWTRAMTRSTSDTS